MAGNSAHRYAETHRGAPMDETRIAEQLKAAILRAESKGRSRYRIAKDAGIYQSQLSRLMAGSFQPRLHTAERIAQALGYRITLKPLK